ncbi:MAG: class II SORL domain-containing protein [Chloroflexota bacterium]
MPGIGEKFQTADWKTEKHVPAIDCPDKVKADQMFPVKVVLGKEVAHPNTTEHHIRWISVYFLPDGAKFPFQVGHYEFTAHGESTEGPNQGPVYTNHEITTTVKISKPGVIYATALCNIHGLWESSKAVAIS